MNTHVSILDNVLAEIDQHVVAEPPERGGALLGPKGQPIITRFILDKAAQTTSAAFNASAQLERRVGEIEQQDPLLELKGVLHSHPSHFPRPSSQDHRAFADSLRKAPWLGRFVAPIATSGQPLEGDHRLHTRAGNVSVYVAEARRDGAVEVVAAEPHVIPFAADLAGLANDLEGETGPAVVVSVGGECLPAGEVRCNGFRLNVILMASYPFTAPTVLAIPEVDHPHHPRLDLAWTNEGPPGVAAVALRWDPQASPAHRLFDALRLGQSPDASKTVAHEEAELTPPATDSAHRSATSDSALQPPTVDEPSPSMTRVASASRPSPRGGEEDAHVVQPPPTAGESAHVSTTTSTTLTRRLGYRQGEASTAAPTAEPSREGADTHGDG